MRALGRALFPALILILPFSELAIFPPPNPPKNLRILQNTENALQIVWDLEQTGGQVRGYRVKVTPLFTYLKEGLGALTNREWEMLENIRSTYLVSLSPGTRYRIELILISQDGGESEPTVLEGWTKIAAPEPPPSPGVISRSEKTMSVSLLPSENPKGPVISYRLAMVDARQAGFFNKEAVVGWKEAKELGYTYYITAAWEERYLPYSFSVGSENTVGGFYNGPLLSNEDWFPALGVVTNFGNVTRIQYSLTGEHQFEFRNSKDHNRIPTKDPFVTYMKFAVGIMTTILVSCILILAVLRSNIPSKIRAWRRSRRRRESHPMSHRNSSVPTISSNLNGYHQPSDFEPGGAYTHLAFVPEEEDWNSKVSSALNSVACVPRATVTLPEGEEDDAVKHYRNGKFGKIFLSTKNEGPKVELLQLPSPTSTSGSWDEEKYSSLNALIKPTSHVNVVSLMGFLQTEKHLYLALNHEEIILKSELLAVREHPQESPRIALELLLCAMGVAEGLFHLNTFKVMHGQLCGWRVVLPAKGEWANPKITGFGILSYEPRKDRLWNPLRWTAVEQLVNRCSPPSDSWAFGILLWEIATLGGTPYGEIRSEDLRRRVERGVRPQQLSNMGDGLYQIMLTCWQLDKDERPDSGSLACSIHELLSRANEELTILESIKWPPYQESLEFYPCTND